MVERPSRDLAALPVRRPDEPLPNQGAPFHYSRQWHVPSRVRDSRSPMTVGVRALRLGFLLDVGLHVPFDLYAPWRWSRTGNEGNDDNDKVRAQG